MCSAGLSSPGVPGSSREEAGGEDKDGEGERSLTRKNSSPSESRSSPAASRDISSCGLCDHKPFANRSLLYYHYSISHFWENLKSFVNLKEKSCILCGYESQILPQLLQHVGVTHNKVENYLDLSLHVPKWKVISNKKSSNHECCICQKQFSGKFLLESHQASHFKEEFKQFIDEVELRCKICHSTSSSVYNLRIHVAVTHKKLDEVMAATSTSPKETGYKQSLDQLSLDLEISGDEDQEGPDMNQDYVTSEDGSMDNIDDDEFEKEKERKEKHFRKRLRVPSKEDRVKKRKRFCQWTVAKVQEKVKLPNSTAVEGDGEKDSEGFALLEGSRQDQASGGLLPSDHNRDSSHSNAEDKEDRSSQKRDEIDDLLSDSD